MRIRTQSRAIIATLAAALAMTAVDLRPVAAAASPHKAESAKLSHSDATEFSSRSRHHRGGNRAAAGAIIGAFGAVAGLAAAESARRSYYRGGYYDYGYSAPYDEGYAQPYAYGAPYGYAPYSDYGPRNEYFPP